MSNYESESLEIQDLLQRAADGDADAFNSLFEREREQLVHFIEHRMDPGLKRRFDASDVVQETYVETLERFEDYVQRHPMPFSLWVRKNALERFLKLRRTHLNTQKRSIDREFRADHSSVSLANLLYSKSATPSEQLIHSENAAKLAHCITDLPDADREILILRHIENYSYRQIACILDLEEATCRKRYGRALIRLQKMVKDEGG